MEIPSSALFSIILATILLASSLWVSATPHYGIAGQNRLDRKQVESGLAWTDSTADTITLYRGATDPYWNYVSVRIWKIKETPLPPFSVNQTSPFFL